MHTPCTYHARTMRIPAARRAILPILTTYLQLGELYLLYLLRTCSSVSSSASRSPSAAAVLLCRFHRPSTLVTRGCRVEPLCNTAAAGRDRSSDLVGR
eukprot:scaffold130423_cov57-Phaeocystis_antarctica.AAC.1